MGRGLYINLNDGRRPLEITARLRCPSRAAAFAGGAGFTSAVIGGLVPGSIPFFIPTQAAAYSEPVGTAIIGSIHWLRGCSFSGNVMIHDSRNGDSAENRMFAGDVWQFLPPSNPSGNRGLLIQDSTDFSIISDTSTIASLVWNGELTINGEAYLPADGIVFAKWNHGSASLMRYNGKLYAYESKTGYGDIPASITATLCIFAVTPPVPGRGLNIFNSAGQCTFSTTRKPLIFSGGVFAPTSNWQDIGDNMVPLGTYGYSSTTGGGWDSVRIRGLMMTGNLVKTGNSYTRWVFTDRYSIVGEGNCSIALPTIPNIY